VTLAVHAAHYALVVGGLLGVALLLLPPLAGRAAPRTPQEQRIADLRYTAAVGLLGKGVLVAQPRPVRRARPVSELWLPLAVTSSATAAGVHAGVGPAHLEEGLLVGGFFVVSSMSQLAWAALALRGCSRALLHLGVAGNLACIALWVVTRTVGLPLTGTEAVGPWGLTAVVAEAAVVAACLHQLSRGADESAVAPWGRWSWIARAWLVTSALALGLLTGTGAGA